VRLPRHVQKNKRVGEIWKHDLRTLFSSILCRRPRSSHARQVYLCRRNHSAAPHGRFSGYSFALQVRYHCLSFSFPTRIAEKCIHRLNGKRNRCTVLVFEKVRLVLYLWLISNSLVARLSLTEVKTHTAVVGLDGKHAWLTKPLRWYSASTLY